MYVSSHAEADEAMEELGQMFEECERLKSIIVRIFARDGAVGGASYGMGLKVSCETYFEASSRASERDVKVMVTLSS